MNILRLIFLLFPIFALLACNPDDNQPVETDPTQVYPINALFNGFSDIGEITVWVKSGGGFVQVDKNLTLMDDDVYFNNLDNAILASAYTFESDSMARIAPHPTQPIDTMDVAYTVDSNHIEFIQDFGTVINIIEAEGTREAFIVKGTAFNAKHHLCTCPGFGIKKEIDYWMDNEFEDGDSIAIYNFNIHYAK